MSNHDISHLPSNSPQHTHECNESGNHDDLDNDFVFIQNKSDDIENHEENRKITKENLNCQSILLRKKELSLESEIEKLKLKYDREVKSHESVIQFLNHKIQKIDTARKKYNETFFETKLEQLESELESLTTERKENLSTLMELRRRYELEEEKHEVAEGDNYYCLDTPILLQNVQLRLRREKIEQQRRTREAVKEENISKMNYAANILQSNYKRYRRRRRRRPVVTSLSTTSSSNNNTKKGTGKKKAGKKKK